MTDEIPWNHSHKCKRCGEIWAHGLNSPEYRKAHECPRCGVEQSIVHEFASPAAERAWFQNQYGVGSKEELLATILRDFRR